MFKPYNQNFYLLVSFAGLALINERNVAVVGEEGFFLALALVVRKRL